MPATTSRERQGAGGVLGGPQMNPDGSADRPEELMAMLSSIPSQMERLPQDMQHAIRNNDVDGFQKSLRDVAEARKKAKEEEARFMRLAAEDPLNPEVQARLEEAIQQKNIAENFENAIEHNPEAFATVVMLYVDMEVNGVPMKAFVDSGAQMTIM